MKIVIANDHAAVSLKMEIMQYLQELGHEVVNIGTDVAERCNYPDFGERAARMVAAGEADCGVLICGTGVGISIAANKVKGIRAAVCTNEFCAEMTRRHNNANILCMGGKVVDRELALKMLDIFLHTEFDGERHQRRIDQITQIEEGEL